MIHYKPELEDDEGREADDVICIKSAICWRSDIGVKQPPEPLENPLGLGGGIITKSRKKHQLIFSIWIDIWFLYILQADLWIKYINMIGYWGFL